MTVTEVIERYFESLRISEDALGSEVRKISGLIPGDIDAVAEYRGHLASKQSR